MLVRLVPLTEKVSTTGVPTAVLMLIEVGSTVILGVVAAVPETLTVLLAAPLLAIVIVAFWVPAVVGL